MQHSSLATSLTLAVLVASAHAQSFGTAAVPVRATEPSPPRVVIGRVAPHAFVFPARSNSHDVATPIGEHMVFYPKNSFVQVGFENVSLPNGGWIEVMSMVDGKAQILRSRHFRSGRGGSVYFNGNAVRVRVVAGPRSVGTTATIRNVAIGAPGLHLPMSICGNTDDRINSNDARVARIIIQFGTSVSWCTAWLISGSNCFATAGHCLDGATGVTAQFNVPQSTSTGGLVNPGPSDQYSWESGSQQYQNGGVGNDWGVFRTLANSGTGQHAGQRQGAFFTFASPPSANSAITITGHGSASGTRNGTQKTHTGPLSSVSGTRLCYATDTTGGNSGSPVIDGAGRAIGVHSHGGCSSTGGCNSGTDQRHSAFATARANICNPGTPGVFATFGSACVSKRKSPALSNTGRPVIGQSYSVNLSNAKGRSTAVLWSGPRFDQTLPNPPYPAGCTFHVNMSSGSSVTVSTSRKGAASVSISVPNNTALIGTKCYHQWIVSDRNRKTASDFSASNAGEATIGDS